MKEFREETITLVPGVVCDKAKQLKSQGFFEAALELLEENKIECKVYENVVKKRFRQSRIISAKFG
jgi:hypothetical protein